MVKTKVLIIDDSAMIRHVLAAALSSDPGIEIVGSASSAIAAKEMMRSVRPDVITLDLEMPQIDGLSFLKDHLRHARIPTVVISSYSQRGTQIAMQALEAGAVDVIGKPQMTANAKNSSEMRDLIYRVKAAAVSQIRNARPDPAKPRTSIVPTPQTSDWLIAIGSSTGGVQALTDLLPRLPRTSPGIVIVQHMPAGFTGSFAERLNQLCQITVKEGRDGDAVEPGTALVAPGGDKHMIVRRVGAQYRVYMEPGEQVSFSRPSVDVLFSSVAKEAKSRCSATILTGMGKDGANGILDIHQAGGRTFAQDEASCVVFGMPLAAWKLGGAEALVSLDNMASCLMKSVGEPKRATTKNSPVAAGQRL